MSGEASLIARALRGKRAADGAWLVPCPVPSHGKGKGDRNPSLLIKDGESELLVKCFAGCGAHDIIGSLRGSGLLGKRHEPAANLREVPAQRSRAHEIDREAFRIWTGAAPTIEGTLAERYLVEWRGIAGPFPPALRFTPALLHKATRMQLPALLAGVTAPDGNIVALQATFLRPADGQKLPSSTPRYTYGALEAAAVRLGEATAALGLAEGTEDALSAQALTGVPCWATLGAQRFTSVEIPPTVRELHVFADADPTGRDCAAKAVEMHTALGRRVIVRHPPDGWKDWNDLSQERGLAW